nr:N-6 DNA methylase [Pedobacter sp. ASV2]
MLTTEIKNKIQLLWDRLWAGGHTNPISAIEQISYLLFMKRLESFHPKTPKEYKWSFYNGFKGEKLTSHIKDKVFQFIKLELSKDGEPFANAMEDTSFRINNPSLLEDSIIIIDEIYLEIKKQEESNNQPFQDIQGDVYEHLLKQTSEAGKNGQFRTPRHIIQMMAEMLEPSLDGKICDLACGSGGFLVGAYQYIISKNSTDIIADENGMPKGLNGANLKKSDLKALKEGTFYGFDIDQTMVRIAIMNLMMHGITKPKIVNIDTLSSDYENYEGKKPQEKYKYILANPPFTGKINSITVSENLNRIYPPKYNKDDTRTKQTVQSELLFLERIVYMLEEEGKAAVIVPEGVLFNSGNAYKETRKILMTDCELEGVISLPEGVFMPYTNVKTSILLFKKKKLRSSRSQTLNVWFYGLKSDGYSLDTNRRRLKDSPLPEAIQQWKDRNSRPQNDRELQHFSIPFDEIKNKGYEINFNLYQDFVFEPQSYRATTEILQQLNALENEIIKGFEDLSKTEF